VPGSNIPFTPLLVDLGNPEARAAFVKPWGANVRPAITSEIIFTEMSVP
jgi:hypothetical protein